MKKLIITTTASGAGCLKASGIADKVLHLSYSVAFGPVPFTQNPLDFFYARPKHLPSTPENIESEINTWAHENFLEIKNSPADFDHVEVWADPEPNSQLLLLQILDLFKDDSATLEKCHLVHLTWRLGENRPEFVANWNLHPTPLDLSIHEMAVDCWYRLRQETPELWFDLLDKGIVRQLPNLRFAILRMLQELPWVGSGLTRTQSELLNLVARGEQTPDEILRTMAIEQEKTILDYWHYCWILDEFADCTVPLITGLECGPFSLWRHEGPEIEKRYRNSSLSLTSLGQEILAGANDFSKHNPIDRWWGGTHLTNACLWKWDGSRSQLVPPCSA